MDYKLNREALTICQVVYDGYQEQPIDFEFSLPDYCPDIQKILKCQVTPSIINRAIIGDQLQIDGVVMVRVLYLDANSEGIRCSENNRPFSSSIPLKQNVDNAIIFAKPRIEYINCRATSPRRLDIHGAFSVGIKVIQPTTEEFVCGIEGEDIQQKKKGISASAVSGFSQQQFSISEVLEIADGKPPIETILRSGVTVVVQDFKVVANKLILKGEATLKLLYSPGIDATELESMEYVIPYSQILDCNGVTEECICNVSLEVLNFSTEIKSDSSGENTLIEAEIKVAVGTVAYQDSEVTVVTDAYSTCYDLSTEYHSTEIENLVEIITDSHSQKDNFDLGENGVSKIIDVWNEINTVTAEEENEQIVYKGKFNICVLALNAESKPFYFERMSEFTCFRDWSKKVPGVRCEPDMTISNISYRITGASTVEIKTELHFTSPVFQQTVCKSIIDVTPDEEHPKEKDNSAALTIYYAEEGESLWNIARAYCTSVEAIQKENDLAEEVMETRGMLLIPM